MATRYIGEVNEQSTAYLDVTPKDRTGTAAAPTGLSYRVDQLLNLDALTVGEEITTDTTIPTPGSTETITLKPSETAIFDTTKAANFIVVTVTATYGVDDAVNEEFVVKIKNLRQVTT